MGIWGKLAYELEGDATDIAFVLGIAGVTGLIGSAVAGTLVDRFGPKRVLITAEILFVPSVLSALLVDTVPQFALVVGLFGLTSAPAFTAIASLPPFLTPDPHRLGRMNALVEGAGMAALITGSAAGAALAATVSLNAIFVFDAATSIVAVAMLVTLTAEWLRSWRSSAPIRPVDRPRARRVASFDERTFRRVRPWPMSSCFITCSASPTA